MSEYQFVHFLALDRPLNDEQLEFMGQQSSRATITKWEFSNEYHYGDFRGKPEAMLRNGYDVHLHYANYGVRKLMFRLPMGLPYEPQIWAAYQPEYGLDWYADKEGRGGILEILPDADAGSYGEEYFHADELLAEIAPVRDLLMAGDLRPLYVAWLACGADDETLEPPVPAGLDQLPPSLRALAEFYELSDSLLAAAAECSPPLPKGSIDSSALTKTWIARQSRDELKLLVERLLTGDIPIVRCETLARIRDEAGATQWPTASPTRTLAQLHATAEAIEKRQMEQEKQTEEKARRKRLAQISADPQKTIAQATDLVSQRSTQSYESAAQLLADLREALGPERGPQQAQAAAEKLRSENPTLKYLVKSLRSHGLIVKTK